MEKIWPRLAVRGNRLKTIMTNMILLFLLKMTNKLAVPIATILTYSTLPFEEWSLVNLFNLTGFTRFAVIALLADGIFYLQHLLSHQIPLLWRFHRVHHTDTFVDFSTALRIHPLASFLVIFIQVPLFVLVGPSTVELAIILFASSFHSTLIHMNINVPKWLDRPLSLIIVTPDMHRIHHSQIVSETNSNYGFMFSFWDRLFRTLTSKDYDDQKAIDIGIKEVSKADSCNLIKVLTSPFAKVETSELQKITTQ